MNVASKTRTLPLTRRGLNFEMLMWLVTRLTALGMYALVLFALIGALIMGARNNMSFADVMRWAFLPNVTHVQSTNLPELEPWNTLLWKATAILMLLVAAAHGVHGLVVIADDYIVTPRGRQIVRLISIAFLLSMIVVGALLIWNS
jgi:succinate dehydrogenase hydrophobic anchor subunit